VVGEQLAITPIGHGRTPIHVPEGAHVGSGRGSQGEGRWHRGMIARLMTAASDIAGYALPGAQRPPDAPLESRPHPPIAAIISLTVSVARAKASSPLTVG
jgi:hypothetical protein